MRRAGSWVPALLAVALAGAAMGQGQRDFGLHKGLGAISIGTDADVALIVGRIRDLGFNSIQCSVDTAAEGTPGRIQRLHDAGFWVFGYAPAFIEQAEPQEDFQVLADGGVRKGWVCPRSVRRLEAMARQMQTVSDVGADGLFWDFITVESREREGCFCARCLQAFAEAAGRVYSREELAKALDDPGTLSLWRRVREESTTAAMAYLAEAAARIGARRGRPFLLSGYVITSHSDLGMDTAAMYGHLDVGAPMIYQGRGRAPLGWMKRGAETFVAYGGKARNVVCVDTGFWVDQPPEELIATCFDCLRAGTEGYALWPYQPVSADDLVAVAGVNALADEVYVHLRAGDAAAAASGLGHVADAVERDAREAGVDEVLAGQRLAALREEAGRLRTDAGRAEGEEFARAVYDALVLWAEARRAIRHRDDRVVEVPPYRIVLAGDGSCVSVSTDEWTIGQNGVAVNLDEVSFTDNPQNAATGNHALGLLRTRIIGWFDPWTTTSGIRLTQPDADTATVTTTVESDTCRIERELTVKRGEQWLRVTLRVTNLSDQTRSGRLWLWNGWGYPGFLEAAPEPWADDCRELTQAGVLVVEDEGHFLCLAADPATWRLGAMGSDGTSHTYLELELGPAESFATELALTLGTGGAEALARRLASVPGLGRGTAQAP